METLYSIEDAAKKLGGISPWTVRWYLSQGKMRRTKVGRHTRIRESELLRFVRDEAVEEAAERNIAKERRSR